MTTDNIEGLDELNGLIGKIAPRVTQRRSQVERDVEGKLRHEHNVAIGAAALIQRSLDERAKLDEEAAQLKNIVRLATAFRGAFVTPAADSIDDEELPRFNASNVPPTAPHSWVVADRRRQGPVQWVRGFSILQWVLAVLLGLVGLVLAWRLCGFIDDLPVVAEQVFKVTFIGGMSILGFGLGGLLGSLFDRRGNAA